MDTKSDTSFGFWNNPVLAAGLFLTWFALLFLFRTMPQIDLSVANYFYDLNFCKTFEEARRCIGFPMAYDKFFGPLREYLNNTPLVLGFSAIGLLIVQLAMGLRWHNIALRKTALIIAAILIGPLLIVNGILKTFFGRVRPRDITEFGGSLDFTLPGDIIGQCVSNCSFVSGEGSAGGWFLCLGVLAAARFRPPVYIFLFTVGFGMALLRVAFGAHFLSDSLLGYLSSILIFTVFVVISERYFTPRLKP